MRTETGDEYSLAKIQENNTKYTNIQNTEMPIQIPKYKYCIIFYIHHVLVNKDDYKHKT